MALLVEVTLFRSLDPVGDWALGEGNDSIGCIGEAIDSAVRYITVAVPAGHLRPVSDRRSAEHPGLHKLLIELRVAADTILVDHLLTLGDCFHTLWLAPHSEDVGVPEPVSRLEEVLPHKAVVRDVAVVAGGLYAVRAVHPSGIVGLHNMAIDACRRVVACIAPDARHIDEVGADPGYDTE